MTDEEVDRLAEAIATRLAPLLNQPINGHAYRLSQQALAQRRAAAAASAAKRTKPKVRRSSTKSQRKSPPESGVESMTPTKPGNEITEKLSTGLSTPPSRPLTTDVFLAYAAAYKLRYGTFPVRNAKVNGMLAQYVKRVPADEAAPVAAYYVASEAQLYVRASHCIDLLLRDAEALRMSWATGRQAVTRVNGAQVTTVQKPWWEVWSALVEQGTELGIEQGDNPTVYRFEVLRAAYVAGRLPEEVATTLGVSSDRPIDPF